jgi:hypothetical protein
MAITDETIARALKASDKAVVTGLLHLFGWQTEDERDTLHTKWKNDRGFRVNHAKRGSELAERVCKGESLTVLEMTEAREICLCYSKTQLLDLARKIHTEAI